MKKHGIQKTKFASPAEILDPDIATGDIIVCDISGSMDDGSFEPCKTKRRMMYEATAAYLEIKRAHRPQDHVAVIAYQTTATVCCPFLNVGRHSDQVLKALHQMEQLPSGGTSMKAGLRKVLRLLGGSVGSALLRNGLVRCLAYSDGYDFSSRTALRLADKVRSRGVLVETFGVGRNPSDVDEDFLRSVATKADGFTHYRFLGDGDAVRDTFSALAKGTLTFSE